MRFILRLMLPITVFLSACGGGLDESGCSGDCQTQQNEKLTIADVEIVIAQAVAEAKAQDALATIAVTDRVGNVLGVFRMTGAATSITIDSGRNVSGGLENIDLIPDSLAAIAKAITGSYLSTEGNAFSTRTASQIVQEFFNPGEIGQPGGPLFGVQFSSLPCSDFSTRFTGASPTVGPHRSPLGLSADSGGLPLYKNGTPVGGVGVIADGLYSLDLSIADIDNDIDEIIALSATRSYEPPAERRADRITVDGKTFRFSDATTQTFRAGPTPAFSAIVSNDGALVSVTGYTNASGSISAGTVFGTPESGIRPAQGRFAALDGFVVVDANNTERFPPTDASDSSVTGANSLKASEVEELLLQALTTANRSRAQIRRPLGSPARVNIFVVDTFGTILGVVRTRDAPVFGADVALQKARTAAFFSNPEAGSDLRATPSATYLANGETSSIAEYSSRAKTDLGATALDDGAFAFSDRAGGNLSRPYFPDGNTNSVNGPFSKPIEQWSPFSTGLQLDLVNNAILKHVVFTLGGGPDTDPGTCTELPDTATGANRLPNGIQIFPGSAPIYRNDQLIGAIGVSGDGVDQDDMISFLGIHNAGLALNNGLGNAPVARRADKLQPRGVRLRYIQCPQAPFLDSNEATPCSGK